MPRRITEATKAKYEMLVPAKEKYFAGQRRADPAPGAKPDQYRGGACGAAFGRTQPVLYGDRGAVRRGYFAQGHPGRTLIQPGQTLLSLVEYDRVWVIANYKETQIPNIRQGMPCVSKSMRCLG